MKYIKNILKISILALLLLVCVGSIYAADDNHVTLSNNFGGDDLDEDVDGFDDDDFGDDEDLDDDDDDEDLEDDEGLDDDDDEDLDDEDLDDDEYEDDYSDFDYLKFKITCYLDKYGNCSYHNWTDTEEFLNEYQLFLDNPSNYTLNESSEGYETYLKIYDSIVSTFGDYNLTENETGYLKFMVIFYLNHYGNVSANYTWNESESFANFTPSKYLLGAYYFPIAESTAFHEFDNYINSFYPFNTTLTNSTAVNQTDTDNQTFIGNQTDVGVEYRWETNVLILMLMIVLVILVII